MFLSDLEQAVLATMDRWYAREDYDCPVSETILPAPHEVKDFWDGLLD